MKSTENKTKTRVRRTVVTLVTVAALAVAPSAFAAGGTPSDAQYHATLTEISAGGSHEPSATSAAASTGGSLPFTGFDVVAMAAVAAGLGIAGFAMRRRVQASHDDGTH
jgi:hypothetical protein